MQPTMNLSVEGGAKLRGTVVTNTSKNGAVGLLAAALLNKSTTTLRGMPHLEALTSIGMGIHWDGDDLTLTPPKKYNLKAIDAAAAMKTRSIIMYIGSLMHHFASFSIPQSGGCKLGSRTVRPHFYALEHFGVHIDNKDTAFKVTVDKKVPEEIILYESGDTVTENALLAAALTEGLTTIKYASANYMVQELCFFLEACGIIIEGIGTSTLRVHGIHEINTPIVYDLAEDPTDAMFFLTAAIVTNSALAITRVPIDFLELELLKLEKMHFAYTRSKPYFSKNGRTRLVDIKTKPSALVALEEKIHPNVYPGLNADNLPFFAVIATQAEGTTLIHDWMYEKRAIYFTELDKLGAHTDLADPHRIFIHGKTPLHANELVCPPALRPATILLIAMLGAKGHSILRNIYSINRGYEGLVERLSALGAKISYLS